MPNPVTSWDSGLFALDRNLNIIQSPTRTDIVPETNYLDRNEVIDRSASYSPIVPVLVTQFIPATIVPSSAPAGGSVGYGF